LKKHISYSEWKTWHICPHYHKLTYIDKIGGFEGNIYTAFGSALHEVCEHRLINPKKYSTLDAQKDLFKKELVKELKKLPQEAKEDAAANHNLEQWKMQGYEIIDEMYESLQDKFGEIGKDWWVLTAEELLMVPFDDYDFKFKGFIDLVIATSDNKIHLIDWKTTSWGWNSRKKSDSTLAYQLVYYKYFYAKKHDVDPKDVECHFALLKRTAKPGKKVEFVSVTTGPKRIENALNTLNAAVYNITNKRYTKNKLNCRSCKDRFGTCEFYQTEYCS